MLTAKTKKSILAAQKNEITEYLIYGKLAEAIKNVHNQKILRDISKDELKHYNFWKEITKKEVKPSKFQIWKYYFIARVLGLTFGLKLMEKGEEQAQINYDKLAESVPGAAKIMKEEDEHEKQLLNMIDEEKLKYVGSMVLGLNDALVELLGALAGFTLALQNTRLIAMVGLITGIAASLSMGASEYLSTKTEEGEQHPLKASLYTGFAYVFAVILLIFPFFVFQNVYFCLGFSVFNAILLILVFTFYVSVAKDISFRKRFAEMAGISLGVAALTFGIGFLIRIFFDIEI